MKRPIDRIYYSDQLWLQLDTEDLKIEDFREVQDFKVQYGSQSFRSTAVIQSKNKILQIHILSPMGISLLEAELLGKDLKVKKNDLLPKEFKSDYLLMDFLWIHLDKDKLVENSSSGLRIVDQGLQRKIFFQDKKIVEILRSSNKSGQKEILFKNLDRGYSFHIRILQEGFGD